MNGRKNKSNTPSKFIFSHVYNVEKQKQIINNGGKKWVRKFLKLADKLAFSPRHLCAPRNHPDMFSLFRSTCIQWLVIYHSYISSEQRERALLRYEQIHTYIQCTNIYHRVYSLCVRNTKKKIEPERNGSTNLKRANHSRFLIISFDLGSDNSLHSSSGTPLPFYLNDLDFILFIFFFTISIRNNTTMLLQFLFSQTNFVINSIEYKRLAIFS